ncbi:hypothetical protein CCY99_01470 [Helicobacter sp. 16-1353]|uniref:sensor histidine kinase n=1 Tax=Helicobacter sp. 16-1353 TaxID=2004996 RepID=UPI000DCC13B2|nr:HAMP domain-containing sensor histidine kinase [Helicobacter sp. 16-1353]RAX54850.1 hypothetical protein CCY99_01470 [Helicobacter sp. 16-1353]
MIKSLKGRITAFFLALISVYFAINLTFLLNHINNEKRDNLEILLSHALSESMDYIKEKQDKTELGFLYNIPHMTSVLKKSGAREIEFFFSDEKYEPKEYEIAVSKRLKNGTYFNLKSDDSEVRKYILEATQALIFQHLGYLVLVGILGVYFINRLLLPLGHLANQCKNYQDGNKFYLNDKNVGSEIKQIEHALNALVSRFDELRKKDNEIFATATHELKTPMAIIKARVEKYSENLKYAKESFISDINEDIKRLYLEVKSILYFNIFDFDEKAVFSVKGEISEAISKVDLLLKNRGLRVEILGDDFMLESRRNLFVKMFMSIFENAIAYAKMGTKIEISIEDSGESGVESVAESSLDSAESVESRVKSGESRAESALNSSGESLDSAESSTDSSKSRKIIRVKNEQGGEVNLFSSKLGIKILEKISKELDFSFEIIKDDKFYEVVIYFN